MACFQLVNCQDGVTVMWITDDTLNPTLVIGQIISCNEVQGHCLEVQDSTIQPCSGTVVTGIVVWPDCQTCLTPLCACPQGYTQVTLPNGQQVCRQDTVTLAAGPIPPAGCEFITAVIGCPTCASGNFNQNVVYNQFGAKVYQNISSNPWPVNLNIITPCTSLAFQDNSTGPVSVTNANSSPLWGDGSSITSGRHNNAAVWNKFWAPTTCGGNPLVGFFGFTYCLVVSTTTTYFFAASGRSFRLVINGQIAINNPLGNQLGTDNLHIFPITLPPGNYILEMTGAEQGGSACNTPTFATIGFTWEIYAGVGLTPASLMAMTTPAQLTAVTVYSTLNESGNKFDYGSALYNHRCPFVGQALDNCFANTLNPSANPNIYVCHSYNDLPISPCCYLLTDCTNPTITYLVSSDLSAYVGNVITVMPALAGAPGIIGCFIVSVAPACDGTEQPVIVVQDFGSALPPIDGCSACAPKCYQLTDCTGGIAPFIVSDDLSLYLGQVISVCPPGTGSRGFDGIENATCCIVLTDCCNPANQIKVQCATPPSLYLNQVINLSSFGNTCWQVDSGSNCFTSPLPMTPINWSTEVVTIHQSCSECAPCGSGTNVVLTACTCFTVSLAGGCVGAIPVPGTITASYQDCAACLPKCYLLVDCQDPNNTIITNTDLSLYIGQVIFIDGCPGTCWTVTLAPDCTGAIVVTVNSAFIDCDTCLNIPPPPPVELRPRSIKPGYTTPGCDPAYTEQVSCNFANAAYDEMVIKRYGITMCCNEPIEKWDIKKQLLDLRAIYDPSLCKCSINKCCPPCAIVVELVLYGPINSCIPPTNIIAVINIPPTACPPPVGIQAVITIP